MEKLLNLVNMGKQVDVVKNASIIRDNTTKLNLDTECRVFARYCLQLLRL
jgi:hypothetical protein